MTDHATVLVCWAASGTGVGYGHVVRSGALAEAWREAGGRAILCTFGPVPGLEALVDVDEHVTTEPGPTSASAATRWANFARARGACWVAVDDRCVGVEAQRAMRDEGLRVLVFDDHGQMAECVADLVLDQNASAATAERGADDQRVGLRYALLRRRVRQAPLHTQSRSARTGVVALLGGSPSAETTSFATAVCAQIARAGTKVDLVGGGVDVDAGDPNVVVHRFVSDPAALLAPAAVAFSTAGSTAWELCRIGMPSVLVAVAEDQVPIGTALAAQSAALFLGRLDETTTAHAVDSITQLLSDPARREVLSKQSRELIDGQGAPRIVARMRADLIDLRPAAIDDAQLLFDWANDPDVRAMSFNRAPITWTEHIRWLEERLGRPSPDFFIASIGGNEPIGQIRFDERREGAFEVGLSLDKRHRGNHLSAPLIVAGCRRLFAAGGVREIVAQVRPENTASAKAFIAADFDVVGSCASNDGVLRFHLDKTRWQISVRVP